VLFYILISGYWGCLVHGSFIVCARVYVCETKPCCQIVFIQPQMCRKCSVISQFAVLVVVHFVLIWKAVAGKNRCRFSYIMFRCSITHLCHHG